MHFYISSKPNLESTQPSDEWINLAISEVNDSHYSPASNSDVRSIAVTSLPRLFSCLVRRASRK